MKKAFTLVEVMLAVGILAILAASVYPTIGLLISKSKKLQYDSQASLLLQEGMEAAYNVYVGDWNQFDEGVFHPAVKVTGSGEQWTLVGGEQMGLETMFSRKIEVFKGCRNTSTGKWKAGSCGDGETADPNSRKIAVTVNWLENGANKQIKAELLMANLNLSGYGGEE